MKIFYGIEEEYIDVTKVCHLKLIVNGILTIPVGDDNRAEIFGDPLYGVVKHIKIGNDVYDHKTEVKIDMTPSEIQTEYDMIVLFSCHENKDCVVDNLENIFKFNNNVCVIISDGLPEGTDDLKSEHVHIVKRKYPKAWHNSLIPYHLEMYDYMIKNNLKSDIVLMMASNQLFLRHDFYDFAKKYDASYFARVEWQGKNIDLQTVNLCSCEDSFCLKYVKDIGREYFIYPSNHDGMFFKYDIFCDMMLYFRGFDGKQINHGCEETLYIAYLLKTIGIENMVEFNEFSNFDWNNRWSDQMIHVVKQCVEDKLFLIKFVTRVYDNDARVYIRKLK